MRTPRRAPTFVLLALVLAALCLAGGARAAATSYAPTASAVAAHRPSPPKCRAGSRAPSTGHPERDGTLVRHLMRLARSRCRPKRPREISVPNKDAPAGRRRKWFLRGKIKDAADWSVVHGALVVAAPPRALPSFYDDAA